MKNRKSLSRDDALKLVLLASVLFGGWLRFFPSFLADFPVNDGGMFFVMMKDLQANHFVPPLFTSYNRLDIPFAYPPLTLYIGAALNSLLGISLPDILRWLPALVNTTCVPVFYLLAREVLGDKLKGALAALAFALTPHMADWLSMGGGLTRSFGTLFMMLTTLFAHRLFTQGGRTNAAWISLFGGLAILSHTESTIFAIALPILIWVMKSRTLGGLKHGMLAALGVIALAGPWYGLVISRQGFGILASALSTGGHTPLVPLLLLNVRHMTTEPLLDLLGALGILGVITLTITKQYFIPALLVTIYLVEARSAHTVGNLALAMGAGYFLAEVILPSLQHRIALLLALTAPFLLGNAIYHAYTLSLNHVSAADRSAMQWIGQNTPADSRFLVLTGESDAMYDSIGEWFPALTGRASLTTAQGREWTMGAGFLEFIANREALQVCIYRELACLEDEAERAFPAYDYIYVSAHFLSNGSRSHPDSLIDALLSSPKYRNVYRDDGIAIFSRK